MSPAYLAAVEQAFLAQAGRGLMLSARDLQLIERWSRAGLPAEVVVEAIAEAFDPPPSRRARGLAYVAPAVERAAKAWQARRVGAAVSVAVVEAVSDERGELGGRLQRALERGGDPVRIQLIRAALGELEAWAGDASGFAFDDWLDGLKGRLCEQALDALSPLARHRVEARLVLALRREAEFLGPDDLERAEAEMRWRAVREHFSLPRLSVDGGRGW